MKKNYRGFGFYIVLILVVIGVWYLLDSNQGVNNNYTYAQFEENLKDGDIILMHDIHTQTVDAALQLIPKLEEEGYQLVTVSEMAAAKNKTLENGTAYSDFISTSKK